MTIPTVSVSVTSNDQSGTVVPGAVLTAKLSMTEIYGGFVAPSMVKAVADINGVCVLNLWPNELGSHGSTYRVIGVNPETGVAFIDVTVSVPNVNCALHDIILQPPFPTVSASQAALASVQSAAAVAMDQFEAAGVSAVVGEIRGFATTPPGSSWLECNGESYLKTAYPALAALCPDGITTTFYANGFHARGGCVATSQAIIFTDTDSWGANIGKYVRRSTDGGATWSARQAVFPVTDRKGGELCFGKNLDGSVIIAMFVGWGDANLYFSISTDHGATWTEGPTVTGFGRPTTQIVWDRANFVVFSKETNKYVYSANNGGTWVERFITSTPTIQPVTGGNGVFAVQDVDWVGSVAFVTGSSSLIGQLEVATGIGYSYGSTGELSFDAVPFYSTDQKRMFLRQYALNTVFTSEGYYWSAKDIPAHFDVGQASSTFAGVGTDVLMFSTDWVRSDNFIIFRPNGQFESISFAPGVSITAYATVTTPDLTAVVMCYDGVSTKTMKMATDAAKFRVPGIPRTVPNLTSYIYTGA